MELRLLTTNCGKLLTWNWQRVLEVKMPDIGTPCDAARVTNHSAAFACRLLHAAPISDRIEGRFNTEANITNVYPGEGNVHF